MKKPANPEISSKNTKDQILAAYNDVLEKLSEKETEIPQETKRKQEEKMIVEKASAYSSDAIITDLGGIKLKAIKQLDTLSEELLEESQKLSGLRQAIASEQAHLEELYQIKDMAHTLAVLLQAHSEQKERLEQEREQQKQDFDQFMASQRLHWKEENGRLEQEFQEHKRQREKERKREEEEYVYARELERRKDMDAYEAKKAGLEKELAVMQEDIQKREALVSEKEKLLSDLQTRVDQFPEDLKKAVEAAEEKLRAQILQQHDFEAQIRQKEQEGLVKFHNLQVTSLQGKIKEQETLIKELSQKLDQAAENVQLIACRALDTSSQRYIAVPAPVEDKGTVSQK